MGNSESKGAKRSKSSSFSETHEDPRIQQLLELQESLQSLDDSSFSNTLDLVRKLGYTSPERIPSLVRNLYRISALRPGSTNLYIKLIDSIASESTISEALQLQLYFGIKVDALSLINELIAHCYLTNDDVAKCHKRLYANYHRKEFETPNKEILQAIYADDVDQLQKISSIPDFDYDLRLELPPCADQLLKQKPTMIQFAAFLGSLKIFKFLMVNHADLTIPTKDYKITQYAIAGGSTEIIRILQQEGFQFEGSDIFFAIQHHQTDIFNWILEQYPDALLPEDMDACMCSEYITGMIHYDKADPQKVFEMACAQNIVEVVEFMVQKYQLDIFSGFHKAVINGCLEVVSIFFTANKLHGNISKKEALSSLIDACRYGHLEIVKLFMNIDGIKVNKVVNDLTPLVAACRGGYIDIVELLLQYHGINVNKKGLGSTPLSDACKGGYIDMVNLLLKVPGIDINKLAHGEYIGYAEVYPFLVACKEGHLDIVKILLEQPKIEINQIASGTTPLTEAVKGNHADVVQFLLSLPGIDVNQKAYGEIFGELGTNPLIQACSDGNIDMVKILLSQPGIDVNTATATCPIIEACKQNHIEVLKLLLEVPGIEVNKQIGTFALFEACRNGYKDIVQLLLSYPNIDLKLRNKADGYTPIMAAHYANFPDIVQLIREYEANHSKGLNDQLQLGLVE